MSGFDIAKVIAGLLFFGGLYLFIWKGRERRHIREHRHGKALEAYRKGLDAAHGKNGGRLGPAMKKRLTPADWRKAQG